MEAYLAALVAHWFADFPVQAWGRRWMEDKHRDLGHLAAHAAAYFAAFALAFGLLAPREALPPLAVLWILANTLAHAAIDMWTSKASHHFHARHLAGETHVGLAGMRPIGKFWTVIGLDQLLHTALLIWSGRSMGLM